MNNIIFILFFCFTLISCTNSSEVSKTPSILEANAELKTNKEDRLNMFNAENISKVDMLEAFELLGIQIHKFELANFKKRQNIDLLFETFENGALIKTDTLSSTDNMYNESFDENGSPNMGFIDQLKFITNTTNEKSELIIKTNKGQLAKKTISLKKIDENQFFLWRDYLSADWTLNKKVPLMVFASSWFDKNINNHRFCGVAKLTENTESTDELLTNSTNYVLISFKVTD